MTASGHERSQLALLKPVTAITPQWHAVQRILSPKVQLSVCVYEGFKLCVIVQ